jgi:valyl-tRNA synthetase
MRGREVFYPMGWDDNGLPTERRVQNHYHVRCDPSLPYDPDLTLTGTRKDDQVISRRNFIELCQRLTAELEGSFEEQWRRIGLSVDWSLGYATINDKCRRVAQLAFLRNLSRGEAFAAEAPTVWDVDFQTAVAQAEIEEREVRDSYHRLAFARKDSAAMVEIETTRPELLPSCVALVAHPADERYQALFGTEVISPVFGVPVPVLSHHLAEPGKGTGIAMICTFGDSADVAWWRELNLPLRSVIQRTGRLDERTPDWLAGSGAGGYAELAGQTVAEARRRVIRLLQDAGSLIGEPRPTVRPVRFFEKGDRPLEIVTSRQWYIRNGARDEKLSATLIARGRELGWHPDSMRVRYEDWVAGLNADWLISRQRYFGVPLPCWYRVDDSGAVRYDEVILPDEAALPIDPQIDCPAHFAASQRGEPGGFTGDPDVMDTWATSSLTPQIATGWPDNEDLFCRTYPMNLRPQGPEIIRTWLFSSLLRSQLEHDVLPWRDTVINGWIVDPDRKKMSKSKDNALSPMPLAEQFGADGLRYWACKAAPGTDTVADQAQMKVGRRLAVKVLNASKFVLGLGAEHGSADAITEPLDRAMIAQLAGVVEEATRSFSGYEYHRALQRSEDFFWRFCDDYIELVKDRAYAGEQHGRSATSALAMALSALLRLLAPFLPFVTEEAWSWWHDGSVHRAPWPDAALLRAAGAADSRALDAASAAIAAVRKAKSQAKLPMRAPVGLLTAHGPQSALSALATVLPDVQAAGRVAATELLPGPDGADGALQFRLRI